VLVVPLDTLAASNPDRLASFAARHGIPVVHRDYLTLIEHPRINTVCLSLHHSANHKWAVWPARASKQVIVGFRCRPDLGSKMMLFDADSSWLQAIEAIFGLAAGVTGEGHFDFAGPNGVDMSFHAVLAEARR
jgi:hypothetical protein